MKFKYTFLILLVFFLAPCKALAQTKELCELPLKLKQSTPGVVTDQTISMKGLTTPSLWWTLEQFDPFSGQFVKSWFAYPEEQRIDLIVNRQLWALMNYAQRYSYVNKVGAVAREYQYSLRILTLPKHCLATYTCQTTSDSTQNCQIHFDSFGVQGMSKKKQ